MRLMCEHLPCSFSLSLSPPVSLRKTRTNEPDGRPGSNKNLRICRKKKIGSTQFFPPWEHCPKNAVYNAFHRFLVVETKRFVGSSVNVILTRQICGQRSSRAAESKRRALANSFLKQICYLFLIPKFRGDSDLGRCTFWALSKRKMLRHAEFGFFLRVKHVFFSEVFTQHCLKKQTDMGKSPGFGSSRKIFRLLPAQYCLLINIFTPQVYILFYATYRMLGLSAMQKNSISTSVWIEIGIRR